MVNVNQVRLLNLGAAQKGPREGSLRDMVLTQSVKWHTLSALPVAVFNLVPGWPLGSSI
jgi:hypothetical protein